LGVITKKIINILKNSNSIANPAKWKSGKKMPNLKSKKITFI